MAYQQNNAIDFNFLVPGLSPITKLKAGTNITLLPPSGEGNEVEISSAGAPGPAGPPGPGGTITYYATFYSTSAQNNTTTYNLLTFPSTGISNGISVVSNSRITIANTGTYVIDFSAGFDSVSPGQHEVELFLRKNGNDEPNTTRRFTLAGPFVSVESWNWIVNATAGDYYEIVWYSTTTNMFIAQYPAQVAPPVNIPRSPSVVVNVWLVAYTGGGGGGVTPPLDLPPPGGYTYPNNPEWAVRIRDWNNLTGNTQEGLSIQTLSSAGDINGINIATINAGINNVATGIKVNNITGNAISWGADINGVTDNVGDANGLGINSIIGNTEAKGIYLQNVTAQNSYASGLYIDSITANGSGQDSYGASINSVVGDGNAIGVEARVINSVSQVATGFSANLIGQSPVNPAQVFGMRLSAIGNLNGLSEAYGIDIANVKQRHFPGSFGYGVNMFGIEGDEARGLKVSAVTGLNLSCGVDVEYVSNTTNNTPAYGVRAQRGGGGKGTRAVGQLMRLLDGNLGLSVQNMAFGLAIEPDAGNFVILNDQAPNPNQTPLVPMNNGVWEDGHWFLISKAHAGGHLIQIAAPGQFNAQPPGAGWPIPAGAFSMTLMFHFGGIWYVRNF